MADDFEPVDFHIHTVVSPCAAKHGREAELATYVDKARQLGWRYLGIADHIVEDDSPAWVPRFYTGQTPRRLEALRREAARLDQGIQVLVGAEADMVDEQRIAASAAMARNLDFLVLPPNHLHMAEHVQPASTDPEHVGRHAWSHMRAAASHAWVDIIPHPFVVFRRDLPAIGEYLPRVPEALWTEVFGLMAANGVALEVNLHCVRDPQYEVTQPLFCLALANGVRLSYGSDAHHVRDLGCFRAEVMPFVRAIGAAEKDFVTPETFRAKRPS